MLESLARTLYFHRDETSDGKKIAAFDLDWTITRGIHGRLFKDENDFAFLPNRIATLKKLKEQGYTIVIFTNQGFKGKKLITALERINNIIKELSKQKIELWVFAATGRDHFRKPNVGMWEVFTKHFSHSKEAFFVGDSAGRPQDHTDFDLEFARNSGIMFYTPEEIFPQNVVDIPETQTMFLFVGMPGAKKTTFYREHLESKGVVHVNQDILKTKAKVLKVANQALEAGKSIAIDSTNPTSENRKEFILLAKERKVHVIILYFTDNGYNLNKLRENPVSDIVYNIYFKKLEEPSFELDGVTVV